METGVNLKFRCGCSEHLEPLEEHIDERGYIIIPNLWCPECRSFVKVLLVEIISQEN